MAGNDDDNDDDWNRNNGGVALEVKNLSPSQPKADTTPLGSTKANTQALPRMSQALPFLERPRALDGSLAGDVGFDPLGFARSPLDLTMYREAEVKHGRLAMLAAAGWPLSELFDEKIAHALGWTPVVDATHRAPSVLNGGLDKISPLYWGACLALAAVIDVYGLAVSSKQPGYVPGDLGFDPLGLYPSTEADRQRRQLSEIKHGRLAMIAITAFAVHEFVAGTAVIDQTPLFFKPLTQTLSEYANAGYVTTPDPGVVDVVVPPPVVEIPSPPVLESILTAPPPAPDAAASTAVTAVPPPMADGAAPVVESTAAPTLESSTTTVVAPVETPRPVVDEAELLEAKQRIAELESKLAEISALTR